MLPFYRKYAILICVIAAGAYIVVSTAWSLLTGTIMAATLQGLIASFVVFFGALGISGYVMNRKATEETERLFALYNDACDPESFVEQGAEVARVAETTSGELASWYLSYYGQALLDTGRVDRARKIYNEQLERVDALKKDADRAAVIVNMVPLGCKLDDPEHVLSLIERSIALLPGDDYASTQRRTFLEIQRDVVQARIAGDDEKLVSLYERMRSESANPLRVRVERTWDEAQACFRMGDVPREIDCLSFVVANGNKLALVAPARARLATLGGSQS